MFKKLTRKSLRSSYTHFNRLTKRFYQFYIAGYGTCLKGEDKVGNIKELNKDLMFELIKNEGLPNKINNMFYPSWKYLPISNEYLVFSPLNYINMTSYYFEDLVGPLSNISDNNFYKFFLNPEYFFSQNAQDTVENFKQIILKMSFDKEHVKKKFGLYILGFH